MKLVTVGLPVYNAELYIQDCISSILNQSYSDFELLIINDGSTDESMKIIDKFNDDRITIVDDGINMGLPYRLNQIANLCSTKYLARMDADDIMHFERLEFQIQILEENKEIDVLGTNTFAINENNDLVGIRGLYNHMPANTLNKVERFIHPTIVGKTSWFRSNMYDERAIRCEDAELWIRSQNKFNFFIFNRPLLFYREYNENNSVKYFKSLKGLWYISIKLIKNNRPFDGVRYFFKGSLRYFLMGCLYLVYNLFGLENLLVKKRGDKIDDEISRNVYFELNKSIGITQ